MSIEITDQLIQRLGKNLKDLVLDYVLPGSRDDVVEVEVHRFIRFAEVFEQYLNEGQKADPTQGIFNILNTGHDLPLDHWYRKSHNVEKDLIAYTQMKSEVEKIISQMTLETKLKLWDFESGRVPLPMSYGARWWAGTTFESRFYHWTRCSQMPFQIYAQLKPKLELIDAYMEDRGLMYSVELE